MLRKGRSAARGMVPLAILLAATAPACSSRVGFAETTATSPASDGCSSPETCSSPSFCDGGTCGDSSSQGDGGDACAGTGCTTGGDTCAASSCGLPNGSACTSNDQCLNVCREMLCADPGEPGAACDEDLDCAGPATCPVDVCAAPANTPPTAVLLASPAVVAVDEMTILDASSSTDAESLLGDLKLRWDIDADGNWDTIPNGSSSTSTSFSAAGVYEVAVEARDPGGLVGVARAHVVVYAPGTEATVTTIEDEQDIGATPNAPGGLGFSLREAINYANATAGHDVIILEGPATFTLTNRQLPNVTDPSGLTLAGDGTVVIDGSPTRGGENCLDFDIVSSDDVVVNIELHSCAGTCISARGANTRIIAARIHGCGGQAVRVDGNGGTLGPDCEFYANASGIAVYGDSVTFERSIVRGSANSNIYVPGGTNFVAFQNIIAGTSNEGIYVNQTNAQVLHNVIVNNGTGVLTFSPATLDVRNNIFVGNTTAINAPDGDLSILDNNGYWMNGTNCSACTLGTQAVPADPRFVDEAGGDYRLTGSSPMTDAAADTGRDVNGPYPGNYTSLAPDIGAHEAPLIPL